MIPTATPLSWCSASCRLRAAAARDRSTDQVEARFEERSLGVAYRPIHHDRFNSIARYTRLLDIDPLTASRILATNRTMDVVSLETAYQVNDKLEWVTKEAARFQEERIGDRPVFISDVARRSA